MNVLAISDTLTELSSTLSDDKVGLTTLAQAVNRVHEIAAIAEDLLKVAKLRIMARLETEGRKVTEKGTLRLQSGEWTFEARPTNTGYDPRKVEALVRAKGLDPQKYMYAVLIYKVDIDGMARLQEDGYATKDELEACKYALSYTVLRPVRRTVDE